MDMLCELIVEIPTFYIRNGYGYGITCMNMVVLQTIHDDFEEEVWDRGKGWIVKHMKSYKTTITKNEVFLQQKLKWKNNFYVLLLIPKKDSTSVFSTATIIQMETMK